MEKMGKRVYISVDIEGITGVTDWDETFLNSPDHERAVKQMNAEAAAACRGALAAGAEKVWVRDAHDSARNIDPSLLPEGVRLIRGWGCTPDSMMEEVDQGFDCAVCIGYHSEAGTDANPLAHTINKDRIVEVRLNGEVCSELELNSLICTRYGVPIVFVSGDEAICRKAEALYGIKTAGVKRGSGEATVNLHPAEAVRLIENGVREAVEKGGTCPKLPEEFDLTVRYKNHAEARKASQFPGARAVDACTAGYRTADLKALLVARMFLI